MGIIRFGWLFLTHPFLIWPTWKATKRTFSICNDLYGSSHHKSNKANAFRHALWNVLICNRSLKRTQNAQKSVIFTEKVTDLYEKATKNDLFDQEMDFHNNRIGRIQFLVILNENEQKMVDFIRNLAENAKKVTQIDEIERYPEELVYISE